MSENFVIKHVQVRLPQLLDEFIYNNLRAKYCKSGTDMLVIDWDKNDVLKYLGTYFPRSYAESYCIFHDFLEQNPQILNKEKLTIFDFGCGTGGEILGFLSAVKETFPHIQHIEIFALDGNQCALRLYEKVLQKYCTNSAIHIVNHVIPLIIEDFYDLDVLNSIFTKAYDIILSFKAICEFVTKQRFEQDNAYEHITKFLLTKLNDNGLILLSDVTTYNNVSLEWLPEMMDEGLKNIDCKVVAKNVGYNQTFYVSHSKKTNDVSKIAWRMIMNNK